MNRPAARLPTADKMLDQVLVEHSALSPAGRKAPGFRCRRHRQLHPFVGSREPTLPTKSRQNKEAPPYAFGEVYPHSAVLRFAPERPLQRGLSGQL